MPRLASRKNNSANGYRLFRQESDKPRCKACGGEMVKVLVSYKSPNKTYGVLAEEFECLRCGKTFKINNKHKTPKGGESARINNRRKRRRS